MKSAREIAHFLDEYCTLLELGGADTFRTRAYANAVRIFENFSGQCLINFFNNMSFIKLFIIYG